jgi:hypothetical protein
MESRGAAEPLRPGHQVHPHVHVVIVALIGAVSLLAWPRAFEAAKRPAGNRAAPQPPTRHDGALVRSTPTPGSPPPGTSTSSSPGDALSGVALVASPPAALDAATADQVKQLIAMVV